MTAWIVAGVLAAGSFLGWLRWRQLARAEFIRSYTFPHGLFDKVRAKRPQLDTKELQLVAHALRQFFLAYLNSGTRYVSMPSQVADEFWHEFILYTRHYDKFCSRSFGGFLHHTPAVALNRQRAEQQRNIGLRRVWWYACKEENINPRAPTRLPLLFALDAKLGISDGFFYKPDCSMHRTHGVQCGTDFSDSSIDGSTEGFGAPAGSGCGGDAGCGGGCGGGD